MARIAYITNGMVSTLNSSLEFARRLREAGHEVQYISHVDLSKVLEESGYLFHWLRTLKDLREEYRKDRTANNAGMSPTGIVGRLRTGRRFYKASIKNSEIAEVLGRIDPDLVIADLEMHYALIVLQQLRIPVLGVMVWFSIFRHPALPPMHTRLMPPNGKLQRSRVAIAWYLLLFQRWWDRWVAPWGRRRILARFRPVDFGTNVPEQLSDIARSRGLQLHSLVDWTQWLKPHIQRDLPVFSFNAFELEFPHEKHEQLTYVGPMICAHRYPAAHSTTSNDELDEFVSGCRGVDLPIVYCSLGTFWSADQTFLNKVIAAASKRNDWALIVGLGGKLAPESLATSASNVLIMEYAPQLEVLKRAAAAITHGGITTINECLYFGVPMLVCSTGHVDQDGCAARLQFHRLARSLDIRRATVSDIQSEMQALLRDSDMKQRVDTMRSTIAKYEENQVALRAVEELLKAD